MKPSLTATLTVRLPKPAAKRVRAHARARGITPSDLVRSAIEREVGALDGEVGAFELTQKWIGVIGGRAPAGRTARRELNRWKPDRRG